MDQVLAFRLATQGLNERDRSPTEVAASFALQDSPPGAALTAVNARSEDAAQLEALLERRELVALPNPRTAIAIVTELPMRTTVLKPPRTMSSSRLPSAHASGYQTR